LFVAVLVLVVAARLMKRNVDVLMDSVPAAAEEAARAAIAGIEPAVTLGRLRMRQAGPRQFADVVITVPPGAAVGQGHAAADRVEDALHDALPGSDVVVRIVREITGHEPRELRFLDTAEGLVAHLTLGLEPESRLADAHARASEIEERIRLARPDISDVVVHTEP